MPRLAASVRYPERSPCAENSPGSNPASTALCLTIALIALGPSALRNIAPTINLPKNTPALDPGDRKPGIERIHGPARQINDLIVLGAGRFGATQMYGERGEGRAALDSDWRLDRELLPAQPGNLTAAATARGKSHHQNCPVTDIA